MYRWLRNTHLFLGLFSLLFLLAYAVSSVQMAHNSWFSMQPRVSESRIPARAEFAADPRGLARELMDRHKMRGEMRQLAMKEKSYTFRIVRPGTVYEVAYDGAAGEAKVRTSVAGFMGMLNRIHHLGGLWHEYGLLNVWGIFIGILSVSLIAIALTGLYLWFKIHQERVIGAILLGLNLAGSLALMVLLRTAS